MAQYYEQFFSFCELSSAFLKVFSIKKMPDVTGYYTSGQGFGSGTNILVGSGYKSVCFGRIWTLLSKYGRMVGFKIHLRINFCCLVIDQRDFTVLEYQLY